LSPVQLNGKVAGVTNGVSERTSRKPAGGGRSFDETLKSQLQSPSGVKLSAHAEKRLAERNVRLSADESARLGAAVDRISGKGADKSLVLMDDLALVVSARNRVVITALDSASARDGVFTGIDSAVIV
jgi:flagellar operon protein